MQLIESVCLTCTSPWVPSIPTKHRGGKKKKEKVKFYLISSSSLPPNNELYEDTQGSVDGARRSVWLDSPEIRRLGQQHPVSRNSKVPLRQKMNLVNQEKHKEIKIKANQGSLQNNIAMGEAECYNGNMQAIESYRYIQSI